MEKQLEVTVEITNFCFLNCIHCSTWNTQEYKDKEFISGNAIDAAIKLISSYSDIPVRVRFSGGDSLPFFDAEVMKRMKKECPNIKEWIIATSGAFDINLLKNFVNELKDFDDKIIYRISLYGNRMQHIKITRNVLSFDNSIRTVEWLLNNKQNVELTTPIFNLWKTLNVLKIARKYQVPVRVAKLISTPLLKAKSRRMQLLTAQIGKMYYNKTLLTCSLYGHTDCKTDCDYPKKTVLATGKIIGCAIYKQETN